MKKSQQDNQHLEKTMTNVLFRFMDEVLNPRFEELETGIRKDMHGMEHRLKSYMDDKLADHSSDTSKKIEQTRQKDKQFHGKVVEIFKKHEIGTTEDIVFLEKVNQ